MVLLLCKLKLETRGDHNFFTALVFPTNIWSHLIPVQVGFQAVAVNSRSSDLNVNVHLYGGKFNYGIVVKP